MTQSGGADTNPEYWEHYTNLQHVKHALIMNYLNGWLPKLGSWSGRILYFDTHAGRGKHAPGQVGSPIVALRTLLDHKHRESIFSRCEAVFYFIETNPANCQALESEIATLGSLPKQVKYHILCSDCFEALKLLMTSLKESGSAMAPAFIFLDPYGFKVPGAIPVS